MDTQQADDTSAKALKNFLENTPPGTQASLAVQMHKLSARGVMFSVTAWPDLDLYCGSDDCSGTRKFGLLAPPEIGAGKVNDVFLKYRCKNCEESVKTFAICIFELSEGDTILWKYGEDPAFGPPLPASLVRFARNSADLLKKGYRCERQGLGVGAFAYYRRAVEDQKNRIFEKIIQVSRGLDASGELLEELEAAKSERRFTQGIEKIKKALPQALFISGHNPLTLLHNALSEGLHDGSDAECLEVATSIRHVLSELFERISQIEKENSGLNTAVGKLLQIGAKK